MGILIERIVLRHICMPLVHHFETSFSRTFQRDIVIVEVIADGISGWGEVTAGENPFYNEEWIGSVWPLLVNYVGPRIVNHRFEGAAEVGPRTSQIRGHLMTRAGVETACWDLEARQRGIPLWKAIGGERREVACGVSIGVQDSVDILLEKIQTELDEGYNRIKMKIKPGWDVDVVRQVRERFPSIRLMADANSAYTLRDQALLQQLDDSYLMMLEQPLAHDDLLDHAELQRSLSTPICLDESIRSARNAEQAIQLGAAAIINIKLGRVGGFAEAKRVHNVCQQSGVPVWCGGMLEAGIGRAHNIALSTLPNFLLPGDVSASKRYWKRDIISPPVEVSASGTIWPSNEPGFGYAIDLDYLESLVVKRDVVQ